MLPYHPCDTVGVSSYRWCDAASVLCYHPCDTRSVLRYHRCDAASVLYYHPCDTVLAYRTRDAAMITGVVRCYLTTGVIRCYIITPVMRCYVSKRVITHGVLCHQTLGTVSARHAVS